jgi:hypothetical protein
MLLISMFLVLPVRAASNDVTIMVNNEVYSMFDDNQGIETPAYIHNSRTLMPLRKTFSIFGVDPIWNGDDRSISAKYGSQTIWIQIDNKVAKVNDVPVELDAAATITNNRTYVPLRFITETFGITPSWDGATNTVGIVLNDVFLSDLDITLSLGDGYRTPMKINGIYEINSIIDFNKVIYVLSKESSFEKSLESHLQGYGFESDQVKTFKSSDSYRIYKVKYNEIVGEASNVIYFIDYGTKHDIVHFVNIDESCQ